MNTIPDLIPLYDNRPGLRTLLQVEVREPMEDGALQEETEGAEEVSQKETKETKGMESEASAEAGTQNASACGATLDFIASTATLDRYHEVIEPAGWRLESYRRNPVFQNAHNYGDILFTLGKALCTEVRVVNGGPALFQRIQFATEVNPVARIAYGLYKGGFLNAVSVGFIPLRWEDGGAERGALERGASPRRRYLEQELLEVSAVAIPANPDALALGLKSGAVAKGDLQATLELLRGLVGESWPKLEGGRGAERSSAIQQTGGLRYESGHALNHEFLNLARELRRLLRRA
jgi:phage head maturation protease